MYDILQFVCHTLPLGLADGFLEHIVFAVEVHDAILEVELPLVPGTPDFVPLADDHVCWNIYFYVCT